ncbi:MAG: hypothetical protein SGI77_00855 [Pirellulaceae bacterium]|nr:hypothetical protein [Pirellulaceae bacterium]
MTPRSYCLLTLTLTVLGLGSAALLNLVIDPYGQYGTGVFPVIVQSSRTQKLDLLEELEAAPDGLILGSSRVMKIEPSYLESKTGRTFFNAGVSHGRPLDFVAIVRWYHQRWNAFPKVVIIGVDSASLSAVVPIDARIATEMRLAETVSEAITWKDYFSRTFELLGFKQLRSSISSLQATLRHRGTPQAVEHFKPDGQIVYRQREEQIREGTYDFESALQYSEREFTEIYHAFNSVSGPEAIRLVEAVKLLRQHGTQVYLFVTPFHPTMIEHLSQYSNFVSREAEAKQLIRLLSIHHGAIAADVSDLSSFGGDPEQFVDGIHPLESNTRKLIEHLLNSQGSPQYAFQ